MSVTFRVDDVERAKDVLPVRPFAEAVGKALAIGGDPAQPVVAHGPTHPLLGAVHLAFSGHRALVLSPDAVWLTIAQGVAQHVRLNAEVLRPRLVKHAGKKKLTVPWDGPMPSDAAAWAQIVARFREAVGEEVGEGRARLIECDFSTTTDVERVASQIVLMDVYSPFFKFHVVAICGIPEITLLGTVEDWRSIRARLDVIAELDLEWWTRSLAPIADQCVRAAAGEPDVAFWKRIYNPRDAYGGDLITGWVTRFYPYLKENGRISARNPMLALPIDEPRGHENAKRYAGPGVQSDVIPAGPSTASVVVEDVASTKVRNVSLDGGVLAVTQDGKGRLMPVCGWVLRDAPRSIDTVIERIRNDHQATPAPKREGRVELPVSGPADLIALYEALDGAVLFANSRHWRIRARDQLERIRIRRSWMRRFDVLRLIDLPDGTYLALAETPTPVYVRGRADALDPMATDDIVVHPRTRTSSESVAELEEVAVSLGELLEAALDSGGRLDLPSWGSLLDRIRRS